MFSLLAQVAMERLDWFGFGIGSTNRTGAFAASMSLACLVLFLIPRRTFFIFGILGCAIFAYFMVLTLSRGALIAWICGISFFLLFAKLGRAKTFIICTLIALVLVASSISGLNKRFSKFSDTENIKTDIRTELYVSGLKMLSDAPSGWNMPPQEVYQTWYQPIGRNDTYMSLINSHLQFMTQRGIALRILYLFGWMFALFLAFPKRGEVFNSVVCSTFICVFISAFFSNVLNYWVLWILPVSFLIGVTFVNFHKLTGKP